MRYQVGQKIFLVFFEIEGRKLSDWMIMPYLHDLSPVKKIWLKELEVKEHHKVHWEMDPEKKKDCDGYILQDEAGVVYYNQYPAAAYEQTSTAADYLFERHFPGGNKEIEAYFNDPKEPADFKLLTDVYRRITKGIEDCKNIADNVQKEPEERKSGEQRVKLLTTVKEDIDNQLKETFKKKMESKPLYEGSKLLKWNIIDL